MRNAKKDTSVRKARNVPRRSTATNVPQEGTRTRKGKVRASSVLLTIARKLQGQRIVDVVRKESLLKKRTARFSVVSAKLVDSHARTIGQERGFV